ncbi:hypothetical protein [Alteromonas lipotrueae]|uniref:hypothetical protein n=1 Tax=Alteromonas lipotrueae TaxID=2803814 RepID=UPI001C4920F6|nr:hypothetical protein [Alteromonas lipotrueae]
MKIQKNTAILATMVTIILAGSLFYDIANGYTPGKGGPKLLNDDAPLFWFIAGIKITAITVGWLKAFGWPKT